MSTILTTGSCGFICSHLVDKLVDLGHIVVCIDNLSTGKIFNVQNCKELIIRDINDNLDDIFYDYNFDYVFHLAAFINLRDSIKRPKECFDTNVMGSLNLIDYCIKYKVKKIIFSSTGGAIYSPKAELPWTEESLIAPETMSPYGLSKLHIEQYLQMAKTLYGLNYSILRYGNVTGSRQNADGEAGVISIFADSIRKGKNLKVFGSGFQSRDFCMVQDIIKSNILAMADSRCEIYNVSSNESITINEVADILLRESGSKCKIEYLPAIPGEVLKTRLSYDKIKNNLSWEPKIKLNDGLKEILKNSI
jgi:UDP-glucose 4-epimerase